MASGKQSGRKEDGNCALKGSGYLTCADGATWWKHFKNRALVAKPTNQDEIRAENIELKHNLYPIPLGEIQKNPNLTQNPGF